MEHAKHTRMAGLNVNVMMATQDFDVNIKARVLVSFLFMILYSLNGIFNDNQSTNDVNI